MKRNVIIPAWNNTQYIHECLMSAKAADVIWLGIDGCMETLLSVLSAKKQYKNMRLFYFPENRGTYVTLNTLISKIPQNEAFSIFGSDDVMEPRMIEKMFTTVKKGVYVYSRYSGICCMMKSDYDKLGSFRAWPVSADTEFSTRAKRVLQLKNIGMHFMHRQHPEQITKSKELGFGSHARTLYGKFILEDTPKLPVYVKPVLHNSEIELTTITANMATYPKRKGILRDSYNSLFENKYIDKVRLYLNEYKEAPNYISGRRTEVMIGGENLRDTGKMYWAKEQRPEIYFTVDDDLRYSEQYVLNHILKLCENPKAIITSHGRKLKENPEKFTDQINYQHWKADSSEDFEIDLPGTGVSCFDLNNIQFDVSQCKHHGMSDVWVGVEAKKKEVKVICRARKGNELTYLLPLSEEETLWNERSQLADNCRLLLKEAF